MRYLLLIFFLLFPVKGSWGTTLEEAKRQALNHNPDVASLRGALEAAKASSARASSRYYPTIGIAGGVDSEIARAREVGGVGYLYGNVNLFRGFEDSYKNAIADLEAEKAGVRLSRLEFRVGLDVEHELNRYLFTKTAIDLKKKAWEVNESQKKLAKKRQASGLVAESDLMEFDLRDSLIQSDLASLHQELSAARVALKRLLGEEMGAKIEPAGTLTHWHLKGSLEDYRKRLQEQSEAVVVAAKDLAIADYESKLWRSRWMPEIDIETKVGYLPLESRPTDGGTSFRGMLLAKFDLFSGFDAVNQKREGEAKKLRAEAQWKSATLTAAAEVETLFQKIKAIEARVHLEERNETRAKKYHAAVLGEYRRGVRNSADVRLAAEVLFDASLRRESFKYEFLSHKIELERVLGVALTVEPMPENETNPRETHEFLRKVEPAKIR